LTLFGAADTLTPAPLRIRDQVRASEPRDTESWVGWCCSYCAAPLEVQTHGLFCATEGRWFATHRGVHRLLPEERRRDILPFLELYQRVRRDEGWRAEPGLPDVAASHPQATTWRSRGRRFREALPLLAAALGRGPWRVLEVGAGCCWASVRLLELGHRVAAVDVNLDADDGLLGANLLIDMGRLPRAEAEMDALPLEPGRFDLVLAVGSLHCQSQLTRTLVELRRVTQRNGVLLVLDSPVYRQRSDGEARVARRMKLLGRRYGISVPRESQPGYLVRGELVSLFKGAGWTLEIHGWPTPPREWASNAVSLLRGGRRAPRFPILLARRDG
jgi:SAM-dependent methyltransferase